MAEFVRMSETRTTTETALALTALTLGLRLPADRPYHNLSNNVVHASNTSVRTQNDAPATLFVRCRVQCTRYRKVLLLLGATFAFIAIISTATWIINKLVRQNTTNITTPIINSNLIGQPVTTTPMADNAKPQPSITTKIATQPQSSHVTTISVIFNCNAPSVVDTDTHDDFLFKSLGDDYHWVYADGVLLGYCDKYHFILTSVVPWSTQVIAIKVTNNDGIGGLLSSLDNDALVTDDSWKCTRQVYNASWTDANFDDSDWPQAAADNQTYYAGLSRKPMWIWSGNRYMMDNETSDPTIYCRKTLATKSEVITIA